MGGNEPRLYDNVQVDNMFIEGRPVMYMVDEVTNFCAAAFFHNQSAAELLKKIQNMQSLICLGTGLPCSGLGYTINFKDNG